MRFAVIDTETNDLPTYKDSTGKPVPANAEGQPRMASFSMILLNDDLSVQEEYHSLVRPDGWTMKPGAAAINGLTDERLRAEGKPVAEILGVYTQAIKDGFAIVAFSAQFDTKILRGEFRRAGMDDLFEQTKNVCVMRKAAGIIPRPDGKKTWPKLEHCRTFLGLKSDDAHTAPADARDALAVFRYLHAQGVDLTPEVHYARGGKPGAADDVAPADPPADAPISRPSAAPAAPLAEQELPK